MTTFSARGRDPDSPLLDYGVMGGNFYEISRKSFLRIPAKRQWTSRSGKTVTATYVSHDAQHVLLQDGKGNEKSFSINAFSEADKKHLHSYQHLINVHQVMNSLIRVHKLEPISVKKHYRIYEKYR
jgi:hypothetical protein